MKKCTFFGHRNTPKEIEPMLRSTLIDLIEHAGVGCFYVGNNGGFDRMVIGNLRALQKEYPQIRYTVVLAYMPSGKEEQDDFNTVYPEGLEQVPPRYAIDRRNRWMIDWSEYVITYVAHSRGGAEKFKKLAEHKGKRVINLK